MKHLYLFLAITLVFIACSKDEFDPLKPENGQVVELFLDHYNTVSDSRVFLTTDRKTPLYTYVDKFPERELGYTYVIKAKVVVAPKDLMDAPSYWFDYIETIRREKYEGQDTFTLPLFGFIAPSEFFFLRKNADKYYYANYPLSAATDTVQADLQKALEKGQEMLATQTYKSLTLHVKHDTANFGKGYTVYSVGF